MLYFLLIVFLVSPYLIILLTEKSKLANRIGSILIAYALGLLLGNIGVFPYMGAYLQEYTSMHSPSSFDVRFLYSKGIINSEDLLAFKLYKLKDLLLTISIPLALPLLLFSLDIRSWFRMAGKTALSLFLAIMSLSVVIVVVEHVFGPQIENMNKIAGMMVGLYTGGTPNLASLKIMLNVDVDTYLKVHTYDMVPSLFYLIFLISIGKYMFRKFLAAYPRNGHLPDKYVDEYMQDAYKGIFKKEFFWPLVITLLLSVIILAVSLGISMLFPTENQMLIVILLITSLSILASFIRRVNQIKKTFELGMYFILLFSIVVASMADVNQLVNISGILFTAISLTVFGTLFLHALLSKLFGVDADTLMITSTALICSPPFVPMIAGSLKNKEIIISGLTVGIIGYALGNYLGVLAAYLF